MRRVGRQRWSCTVVGERINALMKRPVRASDIQIACAYNVENGGSPGHEDDHSRQLTMHCINYEYGRLSQSEGLYTM